MPHPEIEVRRAVAAGLIGTHLHRHSGDPDPAKIRCDSPPRSRSPDPIIRRRPGVTAPRRFTDASHDRRRRTPWEQWRASYWR
jgi:hypothetical protein